MTEVNDQPNVGDWDADFNNDEDAEEWLKAGGLEKCPLVCGIAARMAADIILSH